MTRRRGSLTDPRHDWICYGSVRGNASRTDTSVEDFNDAAICDTQFLNIEEEEQISPRDVYTEYIRGPKRDSLFSKPSTYLCVYCILSYDVDGDNLDGLRREWNNSFCD